MNTNVVIRNLTLVGMPTTENVQEISVKNVVGTQ